MVFIADINSYISDLTNGIYGEEIRLAIINALQAINDEKGQPMGTATLDANGKVTATELPSASNPYAFAYIRVDSTDIPAETSGAIFEIEAGDNVDIEPDITNKKIVINSGNRTQKGIATPTGNVAAKSYRDISINFGYAFDNVPNVVCTMQTGSTSWRRGYISIAVYSVSKQGFTARIFNGDTSAAVVPDIRWIAID